MPAEPLHKPPRSLWRREDDSDTHAGKIPAKKHRADTFYEDNHSVGSLLDAYLAAKGPMRRP